MMTNANGTFEGRNGYRLEGTFILTPNGQNGICFETSDDFFFGSSDGGGTPAPGFALSKGDPTQLSIAEISEIATATDFLRIADGLVSVTGKQTGLIQNTIILPGFDTVFLWCFAFPTLLGIGPITSTGISND
jgi:hypothetical protein